MSNERFVLKTCLANAGDKITKRIDAQSIITVEITLHHLTEIIGMDRRIDPDHRKNSIMIDRSKEDEKINIKITTSMIILWSEKNTTNPSEIIRQQHILKLSEVK